MSTEQDEVLIREAEKIALAVGRMFPGLCEVVLHDLREPGRAVRAVENNLSGRAVGDPATELGLARVQDPDYPGVVQNYPNTFPDGRPAKSTSIGIKNGDGAYVAALCLNLDVSVLAGVAQSLALLAQTDPQERPVAETLRARTVEEIRGVVADYAAARGRVPAALATDQRKEVVRLLRGQGYLQVKHSVQAMADALGVSRATVYNYLR
ncbi:transcriptional regulator [Streptomyces sp. NPDC060194]|uniref:helix-turn-helix transcriptional regulator n=1 Tax=Streptomyces sp. NPDC060194 TaxID=3347069 RepID=UPI00364F1B57